MKQTSPLIAVKFAIATALVLCTWSAVEMLWRIYGLGLTIEAELRFPPMAAEAISTRAAPLLRAASNAEPIYAIVQQQHVDLQKKHEFVIELAESARVTAVMGPACAALTFVLLCFAYHRVIRFVALEVPENSHAKNAA